MSDFFISFGILSFKRVDDLVDVVLCLRKINIKAQVIILNNDPDFDIYEKIFSLFDDTMLSLVYIWDEVNYGVGYGRDIILKEVNTEYLILLDDDVYIEDINSLVKSVLVFFSSDVYVGAISFNVLEYNTNRHNKYEIPHPNKNVNMSQSFDTYYVIGAGHALRVSLAKMVGGFPKDFGLYGFEEIDLSFRIINGGYKIKYSPDCVVYHKRSPDGRHSNDLVSYQYFVNRTIMAKKYLKTRFLVSCFIIRSVFFLKCTKSLSLYFKAVKHIIKYKVDKSERFGERFYDYVKSVKGRLIY